MGNAYQWITEALRAPHPNELGGELDLERALKWKFLLPILLLQKPPSGSGTRAKLLQPIVSRHMTMHDAGDFSGLIIDLEKDILLARSVHHSNNRTLEEVDEAKLRRAAELLSCYQCSKCRKFLQSNGLGDHNDTAIVEQMRSKYPRRKEKVTL